MTLFTRNSQFVDYTVTLLTDNMAQLGLLDVFYGDQDYLPRNPCASVEPNKKTQELKGAPRRVLIELGLYVILYVSAISDTQANRRDADRLSEDVEALLHLDAQCGGQVIHSMVTSNESGWATKGSTPIRASRLTFEATSQDQLPYS